MIKGHSKWMKDLLSKTSTNLFILNTCLVVHIRRCLKIFSFSSPQPHEPSIVRNKSDALYSVFRFNWNYSHKIRRVPFGSGGSCIMRLKIVHPRSRLDLKSYDNLTLGPKRPDVESENLSLEI